MTDTIYLNGAPIADVTPTAVYYLHTDRLGTPQVATTTQQAVAWRAAYLPFGVNKGANGLFTQNIRFPGQYSDNETGYYQNGFRDYSPAWGRYLESDSIGLLGGINTFSYVGASPGNGVDPLGLTENLYEADYYCAKTGLNCGDRPQNNLTLDQAIDEISQITRPLDTAATLTGFDIPGISNLDTGIAVYNLARHPSGQNALEFCAAGLSLYKPAGQAIAAEQAFGSALNYILDEIAFSKPMTQSQYDKLSQEGSDYFQSDPDFLAH